MEVKFCTVTRYDLELYKEMLKYEGWKLNIFRRYRMTGCVLVILLLAFIQTAVFAGKGGGVITDHARTFFIFGGIMAVAAGILEWKTLEKRKEQALTAKASERLRQSGKTPGEKSEIYWYDDCCEIQTEEVTSRYEYTGLRKAEEGEKYMFLTFGGKVVVPADKNGFRKGKAEKFKKFMEGKIQSGILDK